MAKPPSRSPLADSFLRQLVADVVAAHDRLTLEDTDGSRRDLVRAIFAAIDGCVVVARERVRETSAEMGYLTTVADLALRERSFMVKSNGQLIEQTRFVPLTTMLKLIVRQVELLGYDAGVTYDGPGWSALQSAIGIRNRVTHPKTVADLALTQDDIAATWHGLFWLLRTVEHLIALTTEAFTSFAVDMKHLLDRLKAGDPQALADYRDALDRSDA